MNLVSIHVRIALIIALTGGTVASPGSAGAQPRGPSTVELHKSTSRKGSGTSHALQISELDKWLRRLIGRFRLTGSAGRIHSGCSAPVVIVKGNPDFRVECSQLGQARTISGSGECVGIGTGPGVSCKLNAIWPPALEIPVGQNPPPAPREPDLSQAMMLFGLDLDSDGIHFLQVDGQSLAEGAVAPLHGDTVIFKVPCVDPPSKRLCYHLIRIYAPASAGAIEMSAEGVVPGVFDEPIYHIYMNRIGSAVPAGD